MQKKSQKRLDLNYNKEVMDIVQFGSSVINGNMPNDIDIAVIYSKIPIKEQLEQSQKIKEQLEKHFNLPIHIKSYDLYSLFDNRNFAKESILFYGKSLISENYFAVLFGLEPKLQIKYSLLTLAKKDKIRFNYLLNGKKGEYGLLREHGGKLISPGVIEISPEHEKIFIESMKKITQDLKVKKIFISLM